MPRMRVIKPEFFSSEQLAECSTNARLLFVGLWCFCDDGGVHPASPARLKMEVFPADPFSQDQVREWICELTEAGLLETYSVGGKDFWHVTGWHHQKIDKPTYTHPRSQEFGEESARIRRGLVEQSTPERKGAKGSGEEWSERESNGEERISKGDRKSIGSSDAERGESRSAARHLSPRSPINARDEARQEEPFDLSEVDWDRVLVWAENLGRKVPPRTTEDRRMWFRFAVMADMTFSESWLVDSAEAVLRAKETKSTRQAHLVAVLKAKAAEEHQIDEAMFVAMLGRIEIPKAVWKSSVLEVSPRPNGRPRA